MLKYLLFGYYKIITYIRIYIFNFKCDSSLHEKL
jgi:hypothetical protein